MRANLVRYLAGALIIGVSMGPGIGIAATPTSPPMGPPTLTIGPIESEKRCSLYEESAGSAAMAATPRSIAIAETWRTWLVRDCVDNFASIRTSLEAALASTGKFVLKPSGGAYVVTGRISDVSGDGAPPVTAPNAGSGFSLASGNMMVNMDVTLKNSSGQTIYGALLSKTMETSSDNKVGGTLRATESSGGQALYTALQHQVALAVARKIAFRLAPLTVVNAAGETIRLNYGSPLLTLGTIVQATSPDGLTTLRYNVTSATADFATAELDSEGASAKIIPGSTAVVIESDDPAANGRRLARVRLP